MFPDVSIVSLSDPLVFRFNPLPLTADNLLPPPNVKVPPKYPVDVA